MSIYKSLPKSDCEFASYPTGVSPARPHRVRRIFFILFAFFFAGTLSYLATKHPVDSSATVAGFNPGNIINDYTMGNYKSMTEAEIQAFLTAKNPCNNTSQEQYQSLVATYGDTYNWHFADGHFVCLSEERFGEGTSYGGKDGETAAHIIWQAAQDYKINPQVLIVLLEKEQSLITDTYPNDRQYRSATGYGCPDTAACDSKYYGLKNQIRNAAALFRIGLDGKSSYYPIGYNSVRYSPDASCGSSRVYIENRATGILYRYTPYQPNSAALAAGTGTGNACSSYGNRNFYHFFTSWFGSTQTVNPINEDIKLDYSSKSDLAFTYSAHVQNLGWQTQHTGGTEAIGTIGQSLRVEAFNIILTDTSKGDISYRSYVESSGWESSWSTSGSNSGTVGKSKRIEAIQIQLTGAIKDEYDIYYRVHVQNIGWMGWAKNGESAGTTGQNKRIEAIQVIILKKKSSSAPSSTSAAYLAKAETTTKQESTATTTTTTTAQTTISYQAHVQDYGWMDWAKDGSLAGTTGKAKRLEALVLKATVDTGADVAIEYRAHVQDYGWMDWVKDGATAGTTGKSKRLEAVEIRLTKKS